MDFSLSDDQKLIRDTVRQFMEAELRPKTRQYDRAGSANSAAAGCSCPRSGAARAWT